MEFRVNLDSETEALVREQAAANGQPPEAFVHEAIKEKLAESSPSKRLSVAEWRSRLRRLIDLHKNAPGTFDDSRDSIYPDRAA